MQRAKTQFAARAGVTLIELLVVVTIMVMLMAYATSIIKPTLEDRKSRESAQLLNSYFSNAQAQAATLGRPVGVYLERSANDDNKVLQIYTASTPPPFVGSIAGARSFFESEVPRTDARALFDSASPPNFLGFNIDSDSQADVQWIYRMAIRDSSGNLDGFVSQPLIQQGDTIKFDYKGSHYRIINVVPTVTGSTTWQLEVAPLYDDTASPTPAPSYLQNASFPFQIFRRPQKSIAAPVELPNGMAVDLAVSGLGTGGFEFQAANNASMIDDRSPVVIMFSPSGGLDFIYYGGQKVRPISAIHLLVGSYEYPFVPGPPVEDENLTDPRNRWISILPRSGEVFASEISLGTKAITAQNLKDSRANVSTLRGRR